MLEYAALDTRWLLDLRTRLRGDLEKAGRWHWAQEEFERAEGTQWTGDESQAFLKLKGARDLTRRELARLRELVLWRDDIARELDRATFRVAGNEVLLDLAKAAPTSPAELSKVKGFPRSMSESRTQGLLEAIRRGNAVPDADLPRFPKAVRWDRDPDFDDRVGRLKAIRDAAAERLSLDPGVLCSRDRMEAVARKMPGSLEAFAEIPELRRWQVEVLGEGFLKSLRSGRGNAPPGKVAVPVGAQLSALPDEEAARAPVVPTNGSGLGAGRVDDSPYKSED
jgi:ribonuclease D